MITIGSLGDIVSIIRRRFWVMAIIILIGAACSFFYAKSRPHSYGASALMQIETPRGGVAEDPRGSTPRIAAAYWLQLVQARLMVRDNILELTDRFGLFTDIPGLSDEQRIGLFASAIRIDSVTGGTGFGAEQWPGILRVTATMPSAQLAADVANELANKVLEMNASTQTERALETLRFYSEEERRLLEQIDRVEQEMAAFRNENLDFLPTALDNRPEELLSIDQELSSIDAQLLGERAQLAELAAKAPLSSVEQRTHERITGQVEVLLARQDQLRSRAEEIRGSGQRTANAEAQMAAFDRRLTLLRGQMTEAAARRAGAETAQRMDEEYRNDQFILLERAAPPQYPLDSTRRKLMVMGLAASMLLAGLVALGLEFLRPVLRSPSQIEQASGLRPVVTLPTLPKHRKG